MPDVHEAGALAQLALSCVLGALCAYLAWSRRKVELALAAQRRLTGRTRVPALTQVIPLFHAPRADPSSAELPRFRLTALDGRRDPDGVVRPPDL